MKVKQVKKAFLVLALSGTVLGAGGLPASAVSLTNPLDGIIQQLQKQLEAIQDSFAKSADEAISGITKDLNSDISAATGQLGLPDIFQAREEIEAARSPNGLFDETLKANEVDRLATQLNSAASLSEKGQEAAAQSLTQNQQTVEMAGQEATAAQEEVVTQNVMKRISRQNQLTTSILGDVRAGQVRQQQSADLANKNLANVSESLDGQKQQGDSERLGAVSDLLRSSSMVGLY